MKKDIKLLFRIWE
ncbi:unnamed protein product, partial [Allacma fusca]